MKSEFREDKYPTVREDNSPVMRQDEQGSLGNLPKGKQPFDFGIKRFKRQLRQAGASKAYVNKAAKLYKERLYQRVEEVKAKMEKEMLLDATDTEGAVITTPERSV